MSCELPVCKKCCCCVPLRYGLIIWSYLKLALCGFVIVGLFLSLIFVIRIYLDGDVSYKSLIPTVVIICIALIVVITDVILNVIFIVACYKKNLKLMKTYYYYGMFILALLSGFLIYCIGMSICVMIQFYSIDTLEIVLNESANSAFLLGNILIQIYMILLLRSKIKKYNNEYQIKFVNNATEPQCNLNVQRAQVEEDNQKMTNVVEEENKKMTNVVEEENKKMTNVVEEENKKMTNVVTEENKKNTNVVDNDDEIRVYV